MIQIDETLAKEAASIHLEACRHYVVIRLNFLVELFDAIGNRKLRTFNRNQDIKDEYGFSTIKSMKALVFPILADKNKFGFKEIHNCFSNGDFSCFTENQHYFQRAVKFLKIVKSDIDNILIEKPDYLFVHYVRKWNKQKLYKDILAKVFNYEKLTGDGFKYGKKLNWDSYALTKKLDVNVCLYCNKNWVNTVVVNGNKVTNPQLDHYFSKSDYPLLRLSFYNLIPSCETCNSRIKKRKELNINKHIHPYTEGFDPEYYLAPSPKNTSSVFGLDDEYTISLKDDDNSYKYLKAKGSFDFFHIKDIYEQHGDIISEIYWKKAKYNLTALEDLLSYKMFKGMSIDDAYRVVFANYLYLEDYNKRPFAKLTRDTLKHLDIIS